MSKYDVAKIREQIKNKTRGRQKDPLEFRAPKVDPDGNLKLKFFILPPLSVGDTVVSGTATKSMEQFFCEHAVHWFEQRPYPCPRINNEQECPLCQIGFDLLQETQDKDKRREIGRAYLPGTQYLVNIYFPPLQTNPEEYRDKVMYYNAPKTVFDQWFDALMREDAGDESDPTAFGAFFDEENAFMYQLEIIQKGGWQNYERSKFLAKNQPIAASPDKIKEIMDSRVDLWTKIEPADIAKLNQLAAKQLGDDPDGGFDSDETKKADAAPKAETPKAEATKAVPKAETKAAPAEAKTEAKAPAEAAPAEAAPAETATATDDASEAALSALLGQLE